MDHVSTRDDLQREVDRIAGGNGSFQDVTKPRDFRPYTPAAPDSRLKVLDRAVEPQERQPFGAWLVAQKKRNGWIADLAKWAASDIRAQAAVTPDDVRKRLTEVYAEGDAFEALDDAELDWLAL